MGELYPRHEKRTKNPAETTGNRYEIEILMSRTQKLKGLVAASLRVKNIKRQFLSISLTDTKHLRDLFAKPNYNIVNELDDSTEPNLFNC